MIKITEKSMCSGCYACVEACPYNCIEMKEDDEGFLYPVVDEAKCRKCEKCVKVCPFLNPYSPSDEIKAYLVKNEEKSALKQSSSGGAFSLFAEDIINNGGIVYGAALENLVCKHMAAQTQSEYEAFRKSKYVQSDIGNIYPKVKEDLRQGLKVLFTGTPCQIAGLRHYLNKDYENLICADVICHGVPSPGVFELYCQGLQEKFSGKVKSVLFRHKNRKWQSVLDMTVVLDDGTTQIIKNDVFLRGFLLNLFLRPSCYECKANGNKSGSDITLADYWGVEVIHPDLQNNDGSSLVIIKSQKGAKALENVQNKALVLSTDFAKATVFNKTLYIPSTKNLRREAFFCDYKTKSESFDNIVSSYLKARYAPKTFLAIYVKRTFGHRFFNKLFYKVYKTRGEK